MNGRDAVEVTHLADVAPRPRSEARTLGHAKRWAGSGLRGAAASLLLAHCQPATGDLLTRQRTSDGGAEETGDERVDRSDAADGFVDASAENSSRLTCNGGEQLWSDLPNVVVAGTSSYGTSHRLAFQNGDETWVLPFDDGAQALGMAVRVGVNLEMDNPELLDVGQGLIFGFGNHRLAGRWTVYQAQSGVDGLPTSAWTAVSDMAAVESVGPVLTTRGSEVAFAFRSDSQVVLARVNGTSIVSRAALNPRVPDPSVRRLLATPGGYLVVSLRVDYELEWFADDGSYVHAGPRVSSQALDVLWIGDHATVIDVEGSALVMRDLSELGTALGPARSTLELPFGARDLVLERSGDRLLALFREDASLGALEACWWDGVAEAPLGPIQQVSATSFAAPRVVATGAGAVAMWVDETLQKRSLRARALCRP